MKILRSLIQLKGPQTLKEISFQSSCSPSTTHRYLHSLMLADMVVQEKRSGKYDLGPFASELGMAALGRVNHLNRASDNLEQLCIETGCDAQLSVWSIAGPVIIRWEKSNTQLLLSTGLGSVLPIWGSATGRIFLAYLPKRQTADLLAAEMMKGGMTNNEDVAKTLNKIRKQGYAEVSGRFISYVKGIAAPIFDSQGQICAAAAIIYTQPENLADVESGAQRLKLFCSRISSANR